MIDHTREVLKVIMKEKQEAEDQIYCTGSGFMTLVNINNELKCLSKPLTVLIQKL